MFLRIRKSRGNLIARTSIRQSLLRRAGGSVLELSFTLTILFSICYGLIEYGYYFYVKNTMEGAAREGCRNAIVAGSTIATANSAIENQLQVANLVPPGTTAGGTGPFTLGNYTITYSDTPAAGGSATTITSLSNSPVGDTLTVSISANWGVVGAAFRPAAIIGSSKNLVTASTMRKEGD